MTGECLVFSPLSSSVCFLLVTSLMLEWHLTRCFVKLLVLFREVEISFDFEHKVHLTIMFFESLSPCL